MANAFNLGNLAGLVGNLSGGNLKLDVNSLVSAVQNNPQAVQALAGAIASAKTPDSQTLGAMLGAVREIAEKAPAEQVDGELREIAQEAASGGFWAKLQPYLGNAEKLSGFLPLLSQYAPKAMEALRALAGSLPLGGKA